MAAQGEASGRMQGDSVELRCRLRLVGRIWPPARDCWGSKICSRHSAAASVHTAQRTLHKKRDWAVLQGFRKLVGENIRDALDLEYYSALKNQIY